MKDINKKIKLQKNNYLSELFTKFMYIPLE